MSTALTETKTRHDPPRDRTGSAAGPAASTAATRAFTVLELMIVIGVLSVLLAILLPVFNQARDAVLRARAKVEATALAQAVVAYKDLYGYWPGMVRLNGDQLERVPTPNKPAEQVSWPIVSHFSNTWFKVYVGNASGTSSEEASYIDDNTLYRSMLPFDATRASEDHRNPLNPKRVRFLDLVDETDPDNASLPDPWDHQYIVVMGLNPQTTFSHLFKNQNGDVVYRLTTSNLTAFAISLGGNSNKTNSFIFSAGVQR